MTPSIPFQILKRTNGGLGIYAYVLGQFYEDELSGFNPASGLLVRNPFTGGRKTLFIQKNGSTVWHRDLVSPSFTGTPFDFANMYLKTGSREDLYLLLNQILQLQVPLPARLQGKEPWVPQVSYFKHPINNIRPLVNLTLAQVHKVITGPHLEKFTHHLRHLSTPEEKRGFKASRLPYVTFSGIFSRRKDECLIKHSSLVVFDFDNLRDVAEVRRILLHETPLETQLLFVSPSGTGLKWVLKIEPENGNHRNFFLSVSNYLWKNFGLRADPSGKDVSRACFLGFDDECYLHPRHRPESAATAEKMDFSQKWKLN